REGKRYTQSFANGGVPTSDLTFVEDTRETGTSIWFKPDPTIFSQVEYKFETLSERLRESAFLFKNLKITLTDEREDNEDVYYYEDGLISYINYLIVTQRIFIHLYNIYVILMLEHIKLG